jgi:hypothetical protein
VALPMAPESRLLRTVRGPGVPAVGAALASVVFRRVAHSRQPPKCRLTTMNPYGVEPASSSSEADGAADDDAKHGGVEARHSLDERRAVVVTGSRLRLRSAAKVNAEC